MDAEYEARMRDYYAQRGIPQAVADQQIAAAKAERAEPSGETLAQREAVCEAWHALPDELRKDERLTRLYHALGGPHMHEPTAAGVPGTDLAQPAWCPACRQTVSALCGDPAKCARIAGVEGRDA